MILANHLNIDADECLEKIEEHLHMDELETDSSTSGDHQIPSTLWEYFLFAFVNGGGGSSCSPGSPGVPPILRYKQSIVKFFIKLHIFWNNPYSCCEHAILNGLSILCDFSLNLFSFILNNYGWVAPLLYLIHKYTAFMYNKHKFTLEYRVPSHRVCSVENFDNNTQKGIRNLWDFIRTKTYILLNTQPKVEWSDYMKYSCPHYFRMRKLCDSLGLVCVNRLNLVFDTVHHSYAGKGLKCLFDGIHRFSSILVQITTVAYSQQHKRKVYRIFQILVIGGIGVVVWYKCVNHFQQDIRIPEPHALFKNPTAVVDGYKRVTFWITEDLHKIVEHSFKNEPPFNEIIRINQYWGCSGDGILEKDRLTYIGLAIMIATFLTTGILK